VTHNIELTDHMPVYTKQFPLPPEHYEKIWWEVKEWVKIGVCEPANSKYNSPIYCAVKKAAKHGPKDAGLANMRVVLDYRRLNAKSSPDRYSIHSMEECIQEVRFTQSKYFTTLDLMAGFWQMMLAKVARPYTAFIMPREGQFQRWTSLIGFMDCPVSFLRFMDMAMWGLTNVLTYINNILVHSPEMSDHLQHEEATLQWLRQHNLQLNLNKCMFIAQKVSYLGHMLMAKGIKPGINKARAIKEA
jgi:hypothetical protein